MPKQVVKIGDMVYCPYCGDAYDVEESWFKPLGGSPQIHAFPCATCGRMLEFELLTTTANESKKGISPAEAANLLDKIYRQHPEGLYPDTPDRAKVREIGQALYDAGGMSYMLSAYREFASRNPRHARNLELVWNGIGEWMG